MIFPKRQDYIGPFSGNSLGSIVQKEITREFLIDSIYVIAQFTSTVGAATLTPDGVLNIIKRITLNVTDGARTRNVVDCSGPGLIEYSNQIRGIDTSTASAALVADPQPFQITYPIYFRHPQLNDPEASMLLLPCNRFTTNPLLTIYFGTQADIDQNAAPTFTVPAGVTFYILINRVQVGVENWPVFDTEIIEQTISYPSSGANQVFELPTPGSYTGILARGYAGVAPNAERSNNIITNGDYRVSVLGTNLRRIQPFMQYVENIAGNNSQFQAARLQNAYITALNLFGSFYFDFLAGDRNAPVHADFGSVLDTNGLIKTGARAQIIGDIAGGAGVQNKYLWHRVFGDLSSLKAGLRIQ